MKHLKGSLLVLGIVCAVVAAAVSHRRDTALGLPDSYVVYTPAVDAAGTARRSPAGLPWLEPLALDDERAAPLHREISVGIVGEILRTDYLAKQLVRDVSFEGKSFPEPARAAAREPTVFVVGRGLEAFGVGFASKSFFGGPVERPALAWIGLREDLAEDRAMPQTVTALLARRVLSRVLGTEASPVLVDGYVSAMEVIAREWRVGEGPQGAVAPDAGTGTQRALFAGVRENRVRRGRRRRARPAAELLADPGAGRDRDLPPRAVEGRGAAGGARRRVRAVRHRSRAARREPGRRAGAVPQLPGEAAHGVGARRARGRATRGRGRARRCVRRAPCPASAPRRFASSSSRPTAPP